MKNNPYNNFLTVPPIFTINIPIASSRQAEEYGNFKKVSNFILGEQPGNFHEKYPLQYRLNRSVDFRKQAAYRFSSTS